MSLIPANKPSGKNMFPVILVMMLSVTPVVIAGTGIARAGDLSLEQRLQRIEDEKEIRDLMVQYGLFLDKRDFAGYSQLFAKEGTWSGAIAETPLKGPAAIRVFMEKAFADQPYTPERVTNVHLISNIKIDIDGDRATGYSRWTVVTRNEKDEPYVRLSGRYDDVYIREDGRWKFLSRDARREIP